MKQLQDLILFYQSNYEAFASQCVYFKGKDGTVFLHDHPHPGQLKLRQPQDPQTTRIVLKARQVGSTSEVASQFVHQAMFNPGTSILAVSQTTNVKGIHAPYAHIVENLPLPLRTGLFKARITDHCIHWPKLNSTIDFSTANTEAFRGTPRQGIHMTEVAFVQDLVASIRALRPTCHGPMILESTADGPGTFHELWNDPHMDRIFISWMDDLTCVSDKPLPTDLTQLEKQYIVRNSLTDPQASWFVQRLRQVGWDGFKQEAPSIPDEAFILGGDRFFRVAFFPSDTSAIPALVIHHKPKRGNRYAIGADPASGSAKGDRSAAVILDVTDHQNIRIAASFADRISPPEFASRLIKLAKAYFDAVIVVERNAGYGLAVLERLRSAGSNVYLNKVFDSTTKTWNSQYGFNTTASTRPVILFALQAIVNQQYLVPADPRVEQEFNAFRYNDKARPEAIPGAHDDLVLASALAWHGRDQTHDTTSAAPPVPELPANPTLSEIVSWELRTGLNHQSNSEDDDD